METFNTKQLLAESAAFNKRLSDEAKGLIAKWEPTGLLEELNEIERAGMAVLLENQAKQLVKEASSTGTAANSEEWAGVALPLVRRIFSEVVAKDFVSVQPMNLPSGLVFYLDFKYATGQPGFVTGSGKDSQEDSVYGVTETAGDPRGGLYGAGRFGYSINDTSATLRISGSFTPAAATASIGTALNAVTNIDEFNYDTDFTATYSASIAAGDFKKVTFTLASLTNPDLEGVRAFTIEGSGISAIFPQFTKNVNDTTATFIVSGSLAADSAQQDITVKYQKQPTDITRGDFEQTEAGFNQNPETDLGIAELDMEMRSKPIVAKTRKLKASWTPEFAQDLNSYHSIDAEAELTNMLSEYVSQEIDIEILDMLIQNALTTGYWSAQVGTEWNGTGFAASSFAGQAYTRNSWYETLGITLQRVSNDIFTKTLRGNANFMVVSPKISTILETIPGFKSDGNGVKMNYNAGISQVGSFANQYKVYKNAYMRENVILLGYKGNAFLETGAVYAPYIPLIQTPVIFDPKNMQPRKGVMTRYAKEMVRGEFYGKVFVHGLQTLG